VHNIRIQPVKSNQCHWS